MKNTVSNWCLSSKTLMIRSFRASQRLATPRPANKLNVKAPFGMSCTLRQKGYKIRKLTGILMRLRRARTQMLSHSSQILRDSISADTQALCLHQWLTVAWECHQRATRADRRNSSQALIKQMNLTHLFPLVSLFLMTFSSTKIKKVTNLQSRRCQPHTRQLRLWTRNIK